MVEVVLELINFQQCGGPGDIYSAILSESSSKKIELICQPTQRRKMGRIAVYTIVTMCIANATKFQTNYTFEDATT